MNIVINDEVAKKAVKSIVPSIHAFIDGLGFGFGHIIVANPEAMTIEGSHEPRWREQGATYSLDLGARETWIRPYEKQAQEYAFELWNNDRPTASSATATAPRLILATHNDNSGAVIGCGLIISVSTSVADPAYNELFAKLIYEACLAIFQITKANEFLTRTNS